MVKEQYFVDNLDRAISEEWIKAYHQPLIRAANGLVSDEELKPDYILPMAFDKRIGPAVAAAVAKAARESGVARI